MIDIWMSCLKANEEISAYEVSTKHTKSVQLFYVLNKLETNRYCENDDISVTLYLDHENYRGSANFVVNSADNVFTINKKIADALKIAKTINNPFFKLAQRQDDPEVIESIEEFDLSKVASKVMDAIVKADTYEDGWINSTEIFVNDIKVSYLNSNNLLQSYHKCYLEVELIPTWRNQEKEEFELYLDFTRMDENYKEITKTVDDILKRAAWRSKAIAFNPETMPYEGVTVCDDMLETIMANFKDDINYGTIFTKANHYQKGDEITPYPLSFKMKAGIKGASASRPFDESGISLKDLPIIEDGKVVEYWGGNRFGQYLGIEKPSGNYAVYEVTSTNTYDEIKGPYFELLNFSSPQLDATSGYFGGEVRLALYHDADGNITPVSGLSLAGNIYEAIKTASFAKKMITSAVYHGPKAMYLKDIKLH